MSRRSGGRTGPLPTLPDVGISRLLRPVVPALLLTLLLTLELSAGCGTVPAPSAPRTPIPSSAPGSGRSTLHVVGLGDSVTSGEHCDCDDYVTGFAHLLAQQGPAVDVTDDGESGSTSDGLADELAGSGTAGRRVRSDVAHADVVVVTLGANDLGPALSAWRSGGCAASCYAPEVEQMSADLTRVLDRVRTLDDDHARVLVTTYWNVFPDGRVAAQTERQGYVAWSDAVTRQANAAIAQVAGAQGATLVDLYAPFKGDGSADPIGLLAPDGDHPDAAGTALISRTVLAAYTAGR